MGGGEGRVVGSMWVPPAAAACGLTAGQRQARLSASLRHVSSSAAVSLRVSTRVSRAMLVNVSLSSACGSGSGVCMLIALTRSAASESLSASTALPDTSCLCNEAIATRHAPPVHLPFFHPSVVVRTYRHHLNVRHCRQTWRQICATHIEGKASPHPYWRSPPLIQHNHRAGDRGEIDQTTIL